MNKVQSHPQSIHLHLFYRKGCRVLSSLDEIANGNIARFIFILQLHGLVGWYPLRLRLSTFPAGSFRSCGKPNDASKSECKNSRHGSILPPLGRTSRNSAEAERNLVSTGIQDMRDESSIVPILALRG